MTISNIRQKLQNIDYAWTNPKTYLVLVPGLSLVIQKIQMANILPLNLTFNTTTPANIQADDTKSREFARICKWHLRGSLVQAIVAAIALKVFTLPVFSLLGLLAVYEGIDTLIKSATITIILYDFHPNGMVKGWQRGELACNMF